MEFLHNKYLKAFLFTFVFTFVILMSYYFVNELIIESKVAALDFNGDGLYSKAEKLEWSIEDQENYSKFIGDGGRNIMALFGFPLIALSISSIYTISYYLKNKLFTYKKTMAQV